VRAHIAQVAARRERRPFRRGRVLQTVFAVVGVIETAHCLAILLDELTGGRVWCRSSRCRERRDRAALELREQACCCSNVRMQKHAGNREAAAREESRPSGELPRRSRSHGYGCEWSQCQQCWDDGCPGSNMALEGEEAKLDWDFSHGHLPIGQLILNQLLAHRWRQSVNPGRQRRTTTISSLP